MLGLDTELVEIHHSDFHWCEVKRKCRHLRAMRSAVFPESWRFM